MRFFHNYEKREIKHQQGMNQTWQRPTLERDWKAATATADCRCLFPSAGPKQCYNSKVVRVRKRKLTSQAKKHHTVMQ